MNVFRMRVVTLLFLTHLLYVYMSFWHLKPDALPNMPTLYVTLDLLFLLSTLTAVDARPRPSNFSMLNHFQGLLHRSTQQAVSRLTPRDEVAPVTSLDHPVAITTMFDSLNPQSPFAASTFFDPFHPSEAGRSFPANPQTSQPTEVNSTRPSLMPSTIRDYITSSWEAGTILATSISQVVTVYIPEFTVCPIPPVRSGYPLLPGQSSPNDMGRQSYSNYSTSPNSGCSTHYSSTATPICHTNITPLGNFPIAITDCKQNVTFSTDHGYTLVDDRTVVSKTTKYVAPWDSVVTGVPQGVVQAEVCQQDGPCTTYHEVWGVKVVMVTLTSISTLDFSAVVTGVCFCFPFL